MASNLKKAKEATEEGIKSVKFSSEKKGEKHAIIPAGSTILKTDTSVDVEEIENGFVISKRTEIKYQAPNKEYTDYSYDTKKYYSKENPLSINTTDKSLADMF